ncbi:MAG: sigma-70 family RNA polymerase sigma factor [Planctomycetota bacterium]|nr:sigma-70 family RNA polymerase sigma factor [Planctomycetota bacterium]
MFDDAVERELMKRIARGDSDAFERLFQGYEKAVGNFLFRMCYDTALAEDCLQETFLRLWKAAPGWRGESKVSTFIFQIAKNLALDAREKVFRERARSGASASQGEDGHAGSKLKDVADPGEGPARALEGEELRQSVRDALESLPEDQRMVVQLAQTDGLTYREVAEILNLPVGTVKSRMAAAADALRRKLQRHVRN